MKNNKSKGKVKMTKYKNILKKIAKNTIYLLAASSIVFCIHCNRNELFTFIGSVLLVALYYIIIVLIFYAFIQALNIMKDDFDVWVQFRKPKINVKFKSPIVIRKKQKEKEDK